MTEFAKGGIITGHSDQIPVPPQLGYVLSARAVRELGGAASLDRLAELNAESGPEQP